MKILGNKLHRKQRMKIFEDKLFRRTLLINLCVYTLTFFLLIFNKHFSMDDYVTYFDQKGVAATVSSASYRICLGILLYILNFFGINVTDCQIYFGILLVIILAWCTTKITSVIYNEIQSPSKKLSYSLINIGSIILFANVFLTEWLWYALAYLQWGLSIVGMTYGAIYITKTNKNIKNWIIGFAFLILAAGSYQISIAYYVCVVMVLVFLKNSGNFDKSAVVSILQAAFAAVLAIIGTILITKLLVGVGILVNDGRIKLDGTDIESLLKGIVTCLWSVWIHGLGILPKGSMVIVLTIVLLVTVSQMHNCKVEIFTGIYSVIVLLSGQCVMFIALFLQGNFNPTPRTMVPTFGLFSICAWLFVYFYNTSQTSDLMNIKIMITVFAAFIFLNILKIQGVSIDIIKTNTLDQYYINEINECIQNYEERENIDIKKVGFCNDANISYRYYSSIDNNVLGDMLGKAFINDWSDANALNYYTGRNLEKIEVSQKIQEYFGEKDWDNAYLEQQIIYDGDKIYICVY